jgi:hypothetical protein
MCGMRQLSRLLQALGLLLRAAPPAKAVEALSILASDEPSREARSNGRPDDQDGVAVERPKRKRTAKRATVPRKSRAKRATRPPDPPVGNGDGRHRLTVEERQRLNFLLETAPREVRANAGVSAEVAAEAAAGAELSGEIVGRLAAYLAR